MSNPNTAITKFSAARCNATASPAAVRKRRAEQVATVAAMANMVLVKSGVPAQPKTTTDSLIAKIDYPPGGLGDVLRARLAEGR